MPWCVSNWMFTDVPVVVEVMVVRTEPAGAVYVQADNQFCDRRFYAARVFDTKDEVIAHVLEDLKHQEQVAHSEIQSAIEYHQHALERIASFTTQPTRNR